MAEARQTPALPCPECRRVGRQGERRIGNRRRECKTCNAFAQKVIRASRKRLADAHPDEYERIRLQVEMDLYPQIIENHVALYGSHYRMPVVL